MPIYRAKIKCFVGQSMREADEEFEYNGEFNSNIELVGGTEPDLPVASNTTVPSEKVKPTAQSIDYESMTKAELEKAEEEAVADVKDVTPEKDKS